MEQSEFAQFNALVAEDNDFVRYMVKKYLVEFGFGEVYEVNDGFEGINLLSEKSIDIVVCDINMSPIDGFEFLKHVRRLEEPLKSMPIIFLTSHSDEAFVQKAMALNIDAYLLKPIVSQSLKSKVTQLLL